MHVANLDALHGDPPGIRLFVENPLQLLAQHLPLGDHLRQVVPANRFPQARLRAQGDGLVEIRNLQDRFLGVPHQPENDGVDVHRNGVARQGRFRADVGHPNALVHIGADAVHYRDDEEKSRPTQPDVFAEAQHRGFLPLRRHLDGKQQIEAHQKADDNRCRAIQ